jgi:phosphatidylglycerophosphatase A
MLSIAALIVPPYLIAIIKVFFFFSFLEHLKKGYIKKEYNFKF